MSLALSLLCRRNTVIQGYIVSKWSAFPNTRFSVSKKKEKDEEKGKRF